MLQFDEPLREVLVLRKQRAGPWVYIRLARPEFRFDLEKRKKNPRRQWKTLFVMTMVIYTIWCTPQREVSSGVPLWAGEADRER